MLVLGSYPNFLVEIKRTHIFGWQRCSRSKMVYRYRYRCRYKIRCIIKGFIQRIWPIGRRLYSYVSTRVFKQKEIRLSIIYANGMILNAITNVRLGTLSENAKYDIFFMNKQVLSLECYCWRERRAPLLGWNIQPSSNIQLEQEWSSGIPSFSYCQVYIDCKLECVIVLLLYSAVTVL